MDLRKYHFYNNIEPFHLVTGIERLIALAKKNPKQAKRAKIAVAREFGLPTWKYVNLENALEFIKWKRLPEAQVEDFLDKLDAERLKLEE